MSVSKGADSTIFDTLAGADPGFLEGGSNPSRGGSFSTFDLFFNKFPHETEIIWSQRHRWVQVNYPNGCQGSGRFRGG